MKTMYLERAALFGKNLGTIVDIMNKSSRQDWNNDFWPIFKQLTTFHFIYEYYSEEHSQQINQDVPVEDHLGSVGPSRMAGSEPAIQMRLLISLRKTLQNVCMSLSLNFFITKNRKIIQNQYSAK